MNVSVKCVDLLKKVFIFALVLIMICSVFPASIFKTLGLQKTAYATYDPYSQFFTKAEEAMVGKDWTDGVDYSGLDFSLSGSYYSANIGTMDRSLLDESLHISKTNPGDQNAQDNYSRFTFYNDLNAIASKQATNANGGILKLTFRAPVAGTYKISPENILGTDDKSMLLRMVIKDYDDVSLYNQTFKISKGNEELFSKTLTLDEGFETVYDNIPDDITAELNIGEELTFSFEAGATWAVTELCVRFSVLLTDYSSTDVTGVYFLQNNYATPLGMSLDISPVIVPATATNKNVFYNVEDESVLSVDSNGKVTGKKAGYSKVTAKTEDGGFEAETTICIYDPDEACYSLDELYNNAVTKFEGESSTQVKKNDIVSAWQPKYKNSTEYINFENVLFTYNPWAGLDYAIRFYPENGEGNNNYSGLEQYEERGRRFYLANYGRQDTSPNGVALEFTAPEYGIYTLFGDENISLTDTTINYITGPYGDPNSYFDINFYLNANKIHSEKLTTLKTSTEFPTINHIEMQKNDKLLIEIDTNVWERGQVLLYPKMVVVSKEKPTVLPDSVTLDTERVALKLYGTYTLQTTVLPEDAADKSVSYETSDEDVATVSENGVITAVGVGTATITVKSNANENLTDSVVVTVSATGENFVKTLWPDAIEKVTAINKNTAWNFAGNFTAGVLSDGIYTNFNYALKHDWGNPSAIMFNNNPDENGSGTSKQSLSFYDGKSAIGSYVDGTSVYAGFKASEDGVYTFGPSEVCDKISIELSSVCTVKDLIEWGEDKPFYIKITKNGEQIWPKGNNGYELKPSTKLSVEIPTIKDIKLYKGDEIRVEVSGQSGILNRHATVTLDFDITKQKDLEVKNHVTSIKLSDSKIELSKGESHKLTATVLPKNADNKNVKYKSSNTKVATVDSTGKITAIKQGSAVIYAISCENESIKAECKVTVNPEVAAPKKQNFVKTLWPDAIEKVTAINKNTSWNFAGNFTAGVLSDGIYTNFNYALKHDWGNPSAIMFNNNPDENGSGTSKQSLSFYDGKSAIGSYVDGTSVYAGFKASEDGVYTFGPSEVCDKISIELSSVCTVKDLIEWGEDKPFYIKITKNGEQIWPKGNNGYELKPSTKLSVEIPTIKDIKLYKGDEIRVEVSGQSGILNRHATVTLDFDITKQKDLEVKNHVTSIKLSDSKIELSKGESHKLTATVLPKNADNKNVKYKSSNTKVATVDSTGKITAIKQGSAVIYAISCENESIKAECKVTVNPEVAAPKKQNFVKTLWPDAIEKVTAINKNTAWNFAGNFTAGVLSDGIYTNFNYALKHDWGNPSAIMFNNNPDENGSGTSKQSLSFYDGKSAIGSYVDTTSVYAGFKASEDGVYTFGPSEVCDKISIELSSVCTVKDLIEWGEDKPFYIKITKNGEQIWPKSNNGYELKPSTKLSVEIPTIKDIKLYKGDEIRVEVSGQSGILNRHATVTLDFDITKQKDLEVKNHVTSIKLSDSKIELSKGESHKLTATVLPKNADNKNVKYKSSNTKVATVDSTGKITAIKQGSAIIYAISCENESIKAECKVTVNPEVAAPKQQNFVKTLWPDAIEKVTAINKNTAWNFAGNFTAGVLSDGIYTNFNYALKHDWGNPSAIMFNNNPDENGSGTSKQSLSFYDGKSAIGSYVDTTSVYAGFKASEDGVYTFGPSEVCDKISIELSSVCTVKDLIEWGEDKPFYIKITKNGEQIWPKGNKGYELKPSTKLSVEIPTIKDIKLYKGDEIRVEVSGQSGILNRHATVTLDFDITKQKDLEVKNHVTSIKLSDSKIELSKGESHKLTVTVLPKNADNKNVKYKSSNTKVATVDSTGKITAIKQGSAIIYAISCENESIKAECKVTVNPEVAAPKKQNFVKTLWPDAIEKVTAINKNTSWNFAGNFTAGVLSDGIYTNFNYALKHDWGNPSAIMFNNNPDENGSGTSKQSLSFYDGKSAIGSYVDTTSVYAGFKASEDGVYTFGPSEVCDKISIELSSVCTVKDLIEWGEDKPFYIKITKNGEQIWPKGNNGYELKPSTKLSVEIPTIKDIKLYKGDEIRVEVSGQSGILNRHATVTLDFDVTKQKDLEVKNHVTSIKLSDSKIELSKGESHKLTATVLPKNADNKNVKYKSSNTKVATVDSTGKITAIKQGSAVIYAISCENESIKAECKVTVTSEVAAPKQQNFVKTLWPDAIEKVTAINKNTAWNFAGNFTAGVLSDGIYTNFNYALKHDWGNPSAIMFNNNPDENGSGTSKQSLSFYDGKSAIGSYVDTTSVYAGFKASEDGVYTFGPSEVCDKISIELSSVCTVKDLIEWGEDKPFYIKITKNGEQIWPKGNKGYELKPSTKLSVEIPTIKDIKLYKGDEIRVEVSGQSGILNRHATVTLDFDVTKQKDLEVKNHVTSIKLSDSKIELSKGESHKLTATVLPKNADNKNVKYKSSNTKVATVDSTGKITAIKQGSAIIYAISCENESIKAECKVTVSSFEVINYTPDELKESLDAQIGKEIVVNSKVIEWNTNWSAQYLDNKDNVWKNFPALTTYDWREEGKVSAYSFKFSNWTNVGLENLNGYYQPYVSTEDQTVALAFTAHISGNYRISPDIRNSAIYIPSTYIDKHIVKQDRNKKYKFSITVNGKSIYTAELSWHNNSIDFPTIDDIYLGAEDVVRFVIEDNLDSSSPIDIYFSPVVSLVKPDPTVYAPIVHDASYTVDKNSTLNGKINAIHPNGLAMNFKALYQSSNSDIKISSDGSFIYTPKKNYKGIETISVKVFDSRGKSSVAKLTFMVATGYDGVALLSKTLLKADSLTKGTGEVKSFTYPENTMWKYQYTYDGLCYANGSPKYYDTNLVEVIVNAGWWGYTTFSEGMPQATIMDIDGVPAMQIMAGNVPWGANPIGAMSFFAPNDGLYLLKANDTFQKIKLTADLESGEFKQPVRVWISKNGKKIWPENQDSIELSAEQTEFDFPEITVAMKMGDSLRVCVSGHYENERQNTVAIAPVVYDIGAYNSSLDPNPNIEGGKVIEDDEGEPIVPYSSLKFEDALPISAKGFENIIIDEKMTLDKILKPTKTFDFGFEAAWKECSNAKGYIVLIYSVSGEDYTLERELYVEDLSVSIEELMAGEYMLQVIAVDEYGQYSEVYTAKKFSVSDEGKITFESTGNIWIFVIIIAGGILLIAIASFVLFKIIRKRKAGLSIEKSSNS